jgi:hypothetical protein
VLRLGPPPGQSAIRDPARAGDRGPVGGELHPERAETYDKEAEIYDKETATARLQMLAAEATIGFMRHVLAAPASEARQARAAEFLAGAEQEAGALREQVGNPDAVTHEHGDLPPERREHHLASHMR